ncbi:MAG: DUF3048 domain-containing protein [Lachnospiraceae bacterium]|nr:DUF3048 domain-containing protein [Lachnospiraceae bacterium]
MKKYFLTLLLFTLLISGCSKINNDIKLLPTPEAVKIIPEAEPEPELEPIPIYTAENLLNDIPIIGVREEKDGLYQSFLTGEWKDINVAKRRPLAVQIINVPLSLPQYGLSKAGIIYEAPVEGRVTRLLAFFEDYDALTRIGPVRGTRDYFVYEAMGKEAFICNWGLAVPYCADLINSDKVDNVSAWNSGIENGADEAYIRIQRPDYYMEFTGYLSIPGLNKALERLGYEETYSDRFVPQFLFAADRTRVEYLDYPDAKRIFPGGKSSNAGGYGQGSEAPYFIYSAEDNLYYRYQYAQKMIDEMNDEQLSVSNVIFQYAHGEIRDRNDYLIFQVHGEGDAKIFTNGKVIAGSWSRYGGDRTPAKFYDLQGNEIVLNQGNTWICLIWNDFKEFAVYS